MRVPAATAMLFVALAGCGKTGIDLRVERNELPEPADAGSPEDAASPDGEDAGEPVGACRASQARPVLAGCVLSDSTQQHSADPPRWELVLHGQVIGRGRGPHDACFSSGIVVGTPIDLAIDPPDGRWIRIRNDQGEEALISIAAEGIALDAPIGDEVSVWFDSAPTASSGGLSALELRAADDTLLAWLGFGEAVSDLRLPHELTLYAGDVECVAADECASEWTRRSMDVWVGDQMRRLPYGERERVGDYRVIQGLEMLTGVSTCSDSSVAWVGVAAWHNCPVEGCGTVARY